MSARDETATTAKRDRAVTVVWALIAGISTVAALQIVSMWGVGPIAGRPYELQWWHLAIGYAAAELTVVHFNFRTNTHSFSLSEIPLVIGLFMASPLALVFGQFVGNAAALIVGRRQQPVKLVFNLAQYTLTTGLALAVFRLLYSGGGPASTTAWLAAGVAALASLSVSNALIHVVIRLTGGEASVRQILDVLMLSSMGSVINAVFGLNAVTLAWFAPGTAWLSIAPPVIVYVAYRAYTAQRQERSRLQAVYDASRRLHASPSLDQAVTAAAELATKILRAECVEVTIVPEGEDVETVMHFSAVDPEPGALTVLRGRDVEPWWDELAEGNLASRTRNPKLSVAGRDVDEALVAPLSIGGKMTGVFVVGNHLGDVSQFSSGDVALLSTLAEQLSVSLENARLGDSLAIMTDLKEQLEHEVKARDDFVASVSHELRTPLTAIMGLASELWTDHAAYSRNEVSEFLGLIASQSKDLSHIIEDLLVSARASNGGLAVKPEIVYLDTEVKAVCGESEQADVSVQVNTSLLDTHVEAWADPQRVRQIVRNLITNAQRYGGAEVVAKINRHGQSTYLAIMDNGPGVPDERESAIFEPYERAHSASGTTESVGLGLAVSRTLARLMDGDLRYRREGQWTVFELKLPTYAPNRVPF